MKFKLIYWCESLLCFFKVCDWITQDAPGVKKGKKEKAGTESSCLQP